MTLYRTLTTGLVINMKYDFEEKKMNIDEATKLKGELRKELGTPQGEVSDMDIESIEKVLQKKRQDRRRQKESHEKQLIEKHEATVTALNKIVDGISGFIQKRQHDVQKVAGDVVAKVSNFPDVQKVTGSIVSKVTNWPEVQKVSGKVQTEVTNWPEQKDIEFPDVQKVEVLNQSGSFEISNLPIGKGQEAGRDARPDKYIPVRLTNGKSFYNALQSIASSVGSALPFRDAQGKPAQGNIDQNGRLQVSLPGGGTSGTQYAEGETDESITGTAAMWEDAGNTLRPVSTTYRLPVDVATPASDLATLGTAHVKKYYTNAGAVTDGIIWSPAAGKRWYITDIFINVSEAATITLEDDLTAGDATVWKAELAANSGWSHSFTTPLYSGEDAADLLITTTAGNVYVTITGYEV